ncbi:MAG: RnfABCDGE type electron transport complex subunit B [Candidatus Omnitrophota bacterium]
MSILLPVIVLGSLGAVFGCWLIFAQKIFAVQSDPKIEHIFALLPGSNCGACGMAGCHGLAEALATGNVETISCPVAEDEARGKIAEIVGITVSAAHKSVATLICGGGAKCKENFHYSGPKDCNSASIILGGHKSCAYACLGFGTCVSACLFDAISMGDDGLPVIDKEKCTACNKCIKACPKDVLVLTPYRKNFHIVCRSNDKGADLMRACKVGCIACGKCVKTCPVDAISITNNLALIDYEKCINCGQCKEVCPTKAIRKT